MGWRATAGTIERRRQQLAEDPRAALLAIAKDLKDGRLKRRDRASLLTLRAAGLRRIHSWSYAAAALEEAKATPKAGAIAKADTAVEEATLYAAMAYAGEIPWSTAQHYADVAAFLAGQLPTNKEPKTYWGRYQERTRRTIYVAALTLKGQNALFTGDRDRAVTMALEGLRSLPEPPARGPLPDSLRIVPTGPLSLLAAVMLDSQDDGLPSDPFPLLEKLLEILPSSDRTNRALVQGLIAVTMAQRGVPDSTTETIFQRTLQTLAKTGATSTYSTVLRLWRLCLVRYYKRPERAAWVAESFAKSPPI